MGKQFEKRINTSITFHTVHGVLKARVLKWFAIPFSRGPHLVSAGQEATVRIGQGTRDLFQIGKGLCQGCMLSPCLLTYMQSTS